MTDVVLCTGITSCFSRVKSPEPIWSIGPLPCTLRGYSGSQRLPMKEFSLGPEQRLWVRKGLTKLGFRGAELQAAISAVERGIEQFLHEPRRATAGTVRDQFKKLDFEASKPAPDLDRLCKLLDGLCPRALSRLEELAWYSLPVMFPDHYYDGSLRGWATWVPVSVLSKALIALIAEGGNVVPAKRGKAGRRSRDHLEPRIYGIVEGLGHETEKEGRP